MVGDATPTVPGSGLDADLAIGQLVGEYRIEAKLGHGGFGTVWKAAHPLIGKLVAIKVLSHRFSVDPEMVSRFVAEARAVNQIRHHNIIDIFSFGALDDGRHYYVMEYLDGETLDHRIKRGRLGLRAALPILRGIARAVDAAHAKGIAHRDLKAENVMLAAHPDGVLPKLLDFGIAKLLAADDGVVHRTKTGAPMGTPHYMSPEQCHGRDVDHRTDLYAFGVLAFVMLTGAYPIDGDDYMTILMRQIHDDPPLASSRVDGLPVAVDRVIARLMHKRAADRPASLGDAVRELERAAAGVAGDGDPAWQPALSAAPTQPMVAPVSELRTPPARRGWIAVGAVVVLAGVAAAALWVTVDDQDRAARSYAQPAMSPRAEVPPEPIALAPVPAPVPADVIVTIAGAPPETEVRRNGQLLGTAPGRIQLPRSDAEVMLVLSADGYAPTTITVTPARDQTATVALVKKPAAPIVRAKPAAPGPRPAVRSTEPSDDIEQFPTR